MKKLFLVLAAVAVLFTACSDGSSSEPEKETEKIKKTLQQLIDETEAGKTLDLNSGDYKTNESNSYTITKAITIKNGDLKDAKFTINADNVTFEKLTGIKAVTVNKENAQITTSNGTTVEKTSILADNVTLASSGGKNLFKDVVIGESVKTLKVEGDAKVSQLISAGTSANIKITVAKNDMIEKIDETLKDKIKDKNNSSVSISGIVDNKDKEDLVAEVEKTTIEIYKNMFENPKDVEYSSRLRLLKILTDTAPKLQILVLQNC